jgi:hypothetical protein
VEAYGRAVQILPGNPEVKFWAAVTMMTSGNEEEALGFFESVFAADKKWMELVKRLPAAGLLPDDEKMIDKILGAGR